MILPMWSVSNQSVDELANAGIKMAEVNKLKEAHIATVGAVLATPTKVRRFLKGCFRNLVPYRLLEYF